MPEIKCTECGHLMPAIGSVVNAHMSEHLGLDAVELEAMISCIRESAQGTLLALRRAGWKLVRA